MFFLLAVIVACVYADPLPACSVEGNTYTNGDSSVSFGKFVGPWMPAIINDGSRSGVAFGTWTQADGDNRWTFTEWHSSATSLQCGSDQPGGTYTVTLSDDCETLSFTNASDVFCPARSSLLARTGTAFALNNPSDCGKAGTDISGTFHESQEKPNLGQKAVQMTFGDDGYVIVSISTDVAIFQRWITSGSEIQISDVASIPEGATCDEGVVGTYSTEWKATTCGVQICGVADKCLFRAQLWHTSRFNAWTGDVCAPFPDVAEDDIFGSCSDGTQWNNHPYECIDQPVTGGCAFCGGRVNGRDINICVERGGVACQTIYEQVGTKQYCNLAFECGPASVISVSFFLLLSCLIALF